MRRPTSTQTLATLGRETSFVGPSRVRPIPKVETIENRRNSKKKTIGRWGRDTQPNRGMHWIAIAETEIMAPALNINPSINNFSLFFSAYFLCSRA